MVAFTSLTTALTGHFHKSLASLPPDIQQRILEDFYPWSWDGKSPRERCHVAKQWDYENDPSRREIREGIDALTTPGSPAYSLEESQRLRGDFLPEGRAVHSPKSLPPLEMEPQPEYEAPTRASSAAEPVTDLPWWQTKYDIEDLAQNIGATLKREDRPTSNSAIAKKIETRINDIERSKGTDRTAPNWDTIRGTLTGWKWKPD